MKDLIFKTVIAILESILQDLLDNGKIDGSIKKEILEKFTE
jgi:hypothetical protein